ncbi:hypothetical protein [Natrinema sp. H-ect4]|uniref:DUF7344 domain-containing protein n=1 Tax=Natrinema sp. H-ect4 TaxID=3242699 RepID=UPI0035A97328
MSLFKRLRGSDDPVSCELTIDEGLHLFSNKRRRLVVELVDNLGPMEIGALADAIATITDRKRKTVYVPLFQTHLPKLDEHDVIELGERKHHVEPGEHFDASVDFLEDVQKRFENDPTGTAPTEFEYNELGQVAESDGEEA